MNEITQLLENSITDNALVKSEKKEIKSLIHKKRLTRRELDLLRSRIFDIARANMDTIPVNNLMDWLETANKLTLGTNKEEESSSRVYFSPGTQCRDAIIHQIKQAKETLEICLFTISDNQISNEIIAASNSGIHVKIISDDDKVYDLGSDVNRLSKLGIPVKIDGTRGHMHHKFCIVDHKLIITGSYNWTKSAANRNYENILINSDSKIVKSFQSEFDKLWGKLRIL